MTSCVLILNGIESVGKTHTPTPPFVRVLILNGIESQLGVNSCLFLPFELILNGIESLRCVSSRLFLLPWLILNGIEREYFEYERIRERVLVNPQRN